jgi:nucleotide-binding universal stress UspA family protein
MNGFLKKILVATDGSQDAVLAARAAVNLSRAPGTELHVVHVWTCVPSHRFSSLVAAGLEREAQELLDAQVEKLGCAGGIVTQAHLREGRTADEIADLAMELEADLVTMGRRGLGPIRRLAVGSVSEGVVQLAPCPVLIVGGGEEMWPPTSVIVGDDSSEEAKRAGEVAASVGRVFAAQAVLLRVHDSRRPAGATRRAVEHQIDEEVRKAEEALEERAAELESILGRRPQVKVAMGDAADSLQRAAEQCGEAALVAVGSRGLGRVRRIALGSVSTDVLRTVNGPVLVCPSPDGA